MHVWLQFYSSVGFQCVIFQAQLYPSQLFKNGVELTPSDVTCACGDLARQQLSIIFQPSTAMLGVSCY